MRYSNEFVVTLVSDDTANYFTENTSSCFSNLLCKPLTLPENEYCVAVTEIYFTEKTIPARKSVFEAPLENNKLKTWTKSSGFAHVLKSTPNIDTYLEKIKNEFNERTIASLGISIDIERTGNKVRLEFIDPSNNYELEIEPVSFAQLLGFSTSVFKSGVYISQNDINMEEFDNLSMDSYVRFKRRDTKPSLFTIPEPPRKTAASLIREIALLFIQIGKRVSMTLDRNNILTVTITEANFMFQLPSEINEELGLASDFIFKDERVEIDLNKASIPQKVHNPSEQILICTDIISEQYFGSKSMQALRVFPRPKIMGSYHIIFDKPYFHELKYSTISEIKIILTGEHTQLLPATDKSTTIVLLFKRK